MPEHQDLMSLWRDSVVENRDAVTATLRQFDPALPPDEVEDARS